MLSLEEQKVDRQIRACEYVPTSAYISILLNVRGLASSEHEPRARMGCFAMEGLYRISYSSAIHCIGVRLNG